jgi:hypothetical protein
MIAWGETPDGWTCCWGPSGPDPDHWGVVFAKPKLRGYRHFPDRTFSSFLVEYANPDDRRGLFRRRGLRFDWASPFTPFRRD